MAVFGWFVFWLYSADERECLKLYNTSCAAHARAEETCNAAFEGMECKEAEEHCMDIYGENCATAYKFCYGFF